MELYLGHQCKRKERRKEGQEQDNFADSYEMISDPSPETAGFSTALLTNTTLIT